MSSSSKHIVINDLLACAWQLTGSAAAVANPASLRRAVSTAYYAMFHALSCDAANLLVGTAPNAFGGDAWTKVYRGLQHGPARESCRSAAAANFSGYIVSFAAAFVELQEERHKADYDPIDRLSWFDASSLVDRAAWGIDRLTEASHDERQRFAVHLLFRSRSG